jgi:hypothetical protein
VPKPAKRTTFLSAVRKDLARCSGDDAADTRDRGASRPVDSIKISTLMISWRQYAPVKGIDLSRIENRALNHQCEIRRENASRLRFAAYEC